jgi:hypothetical protein
MNLQGIKNFLKNKNEISYEYTTVGLPKEATQGAKLYASRLDMLSDMPKKLSIAEVGVAYGDFSEALVKELRPIKFLGIDKFGWENVKEIWGENPKLRFSGQSHEEFYFNKMSLLSQELNFEFTQMRGDSNKKLLESKGLDLIYIDAGHKYEDVESDTRAAIKALNPRGHIVFNDYIWRDTFHSEMYGVIKTVNQLVSEGGWKVKGFALHPMMFCDIWIQREI